MIELEDKAERMEETTGEPIEEGHYKSVIAGMIDLETLKQTAEYQEGGLDKFKRKVMEFVNLVMSGDGRGGDSMDIGRIEDTSKEDAIAEAEYLKMERDCREQLGLPMQD